MPSETTKQIKNLFSKASLDNAAARHMNGREWKEYQQIGERQSSEAKQAHDRYRAEYQTRFEAVRKHLINKAGEKNKDLKLRMFGTDRFDGAAIDRQAHRNVRHAHEGHMISMRTNHILEKQALFDRCEYRQSLRNTPSQDFNRAADRRANQERRSTQTHRRTQ